MILKKGNCLELMKEIPDKSVDMVLCDLPYGTTACTWDTIIPFEPLWKQYRRVVKPGAHIVLFSAQPFTTKLINSNINNYKYNWYWKKNNVTDGQFAKVQPMRCIEDVCVFRFDIPKDNSGKFTKCREYLQTEKKKCGLKSKQLQEILGTTMTSHYFTDGQQFSLPSSEAYKKLQSTGYFNMPYDELLNLYNEEKGIAKKDIAIDKKQTFIYNPQGVIKLEKAKINKPHRSDITGLRKYASIQEYTNYPNHLLVFDNKAINKRVHPTQKPVALLEYLIKTYTNENEIVLDNCMGSGSTGVACVNTNRDFIGFELTDRYFEIACERIDEAKQNKEHLNEQKEECVIPKISDNSEQLALF